MGAPIIFTLAQGNRTKSGFRASPLFVTIKSFQPLLMATHRLGASVRGPTSGAIMTTLFGNPQAKSEGSGPNV